MNEVQKAAQQIQASIEKLNRAKRNLAQARNEQHVRVAVQVAELQEVLDILNDPECTPEIIG